MRLDDVVCQYTVGLLHSYKQKVPGKQLSATFFKFKCANIYNQNFTDPTALNRVKSFANILAQVTIK